MSENQLPKLMVPQVNCRIAFFNTSNGVLAEVGGSMREPTVTEVVDWLQEHDPARRNLTSPETVEKAAKVIEGLGYNVTDRQIAEAVLRSVEEGKT